MTKGTIFVIMGNNRTSCLIRSEDGEKFFAPRGQFKDPDVMLKGAQVKFQISSETTGKHRLAEQVEAA